MAELQARASGCGQSWAGLVRDATDDDDDGDRAVVYLGGAIHSVPSAHLASVTTLEHERGKRAHAEFCR